MSKIIMISLKE